MMALIASGGSCGKHMRLDSGNSGSRKKDVIKRED